MSTRRTPIHKKPAWIRSKLPEGQNVLKLKNGLKSRKLHTVCQEAFCPNLGECWEAKTATIMILGDTCTRACKFCNIKTGNPRGFIDPNEISGAVEMVDFMDLKYLVITSVDRDDLEDLGSGHFAHLVKTLGQTHPDVKVEVLIPDFGGIEKYMHILAKSSPFVIAQNIETVKRLTHPVRDRRASYETTLKALKFYAQNYPHIATKSSIMVGLGETEEELIETMKDLRAVGVKLLTIGQYLQPSKLHLRVERYYKEKDFHHLKEEALKLGFEFVASGPMVRSSYKAADYLQYLEDKECEKA